MFEALTLTSPLFYSPLAGASIAAHGPLFEPEELVLGLTEELALGLLTPAADVPKFGFKADPELPNAGSPPNGL
jgi:hypothetical protein